jgi:ArsR family transcriptional regulator
MSPRPEKSLDPRPLARLCRALGDETRVRIVSLLAHGELCVCHIEGALDVPQPTVSRQLAVLRAAGVVETRREGTWVHYRLAEQTDETCRELLDQLARSFGKRDVVRRDLQRLVKAKGPNACK